ncbi:MAG: hypothetical protein JWL90_3773, partial [Chthoniobacteraceae bacterium]|nr:hypothetical protein [Chthoniobacteraceae bacterium]
GAKLTYPLGADLFNSLLALLGVDLFRGLIWVGLGGSLLTGIALWNWGRGFVIAGFLCNGGLLGFSCFSQGTLTDFQSDAAWKSIPLALFVTQRGLLYALPAGLALLCSWRTRFFSIPQKNGQWQMPLWGEILLYASLPLFHLHTFLFLSFLLGCWFFCMPQKRKPLALLIGGALLPATVLVLVVTGMFKGASVLGWQPGWMQGEDGFFEFWIKNFGLLPLFVGALCSVLVNRPNTRWPMAISLPALLIFFLCCFVKFAPWAWDNTKLMIWSYLALLPFLWSEVIARFPQPVRWISCTILFFSGFVSLLGGLGSQPRGYELALRSELDAVEYAVRDLPVNARFAAAPTYNHPVLLAGRLLAMGYEGHVWSHGYDFATRRNEVKALMNGAPDWRQIAARLNVRYIFWGALEAEAYPLSTQPWKLVAPSVRQGDWGEIHDLAGSL